MAAPLDAEATGALPPTDIDAQLHFSRTLAAAAAQGRLEHAARWPADLGVLLMDFLWRFGFSFDAATQGVSVRQGGLVARDAAAPGASGSTQAMGVAIEDPQVRRALRDLRSIECAKSWQIMALRRTSQCTAMTSNVLAAARAQRGRSGAQFQRREAGLCGGVGAAGRGPARVGDGDARGHAGPCAAERAATEGWQDAASRRRIAAPGCVPLLLCAEPADGSHPIRTQRCVL